MTTTYDEPEAGEKNSGFSTITQKGPYPTWGNTFKVPEKSTLSQFQTLKDALEWVQSIGYTYAFWSGKVWGFQDDGIHLQVISKVAAFTAEDLDNFDITNAPLMPKYIKW